MMDNILQDMEVNELSSNIPRHSNKKIRKRKHLDNLLKFRLTKKHSNDILRSSEDELFLPQQKLSITRHTSRHSLWRKYLQYILSIFGICIFLITCIGLIYANIQLKNDVRNLSLRINEMERKYSKVESNNALPIIEQLNIRLNMLERWNLSLIYNELQKLQLHMLLNEKDTIPSKSRYLEKKSLEKMINSDVKDWNDQMNSLKNNIRTFNQTEQLQGLIKHFNQLSHFVYNSFNSTTTILTELQSNLDELRKRIDECQCTSKSINIEQIINQQSVND